MAGGMGVGGSAMGRQSSGPPMNGKNMQASGRVADIMAALRGGGMAPPNPANLLQPGLMGPPMPANTMAGALGGIGARLGPPMGGAPPPGGGFTQMPPANAGRPMGPHEMDPKMIQFMQRLGRRK